MIDRAAGRDDRRGDDVAPVDDRRGAVRSARMSMPCAERSARSCGASSLVACAQRSSKTSRQPSAASRPSVTSPGLVENALLEPGQPGLDQRRPSAAETARRAAAGRPRPRPRRSASTAVAGAANGMILTVATICLGSTDGEGRQGAERHRLVDQVEPVEPRRGSNTRSPRVSANRLARPVKGAAAAMSAPAAAAATRRGGLVLADIAGFEPGDDDPWQARGGDRSTSARDSTRPFLQRRRRRASGCARGSRLRPRRPGPRRISCRLRRLAVGAGPGSSGRRSRSRSRPATPRRSSSPTGPWMRARSASLKPSSLSRAQRAGMGLRREPSAPM